MKSTKLLLKCLLLCSILLLQFQLFAGGILVVSPAGTEWTGTQRINPYSLNVKSLHIETVINNGVAYTTIKQVFHNPSSMQLQGYFLFPVPANSVLRDFQMDINGKMTKAELLDATEARKLYEEIVRKILDPALLEYANNNLFKIRVFPIEPNSDKTIEIKYNTVLAKDHLLSTYTIPLNTQKFSAQLLNDLSIHIKIQSNAKIASVYSPTHQIEAIQQDEFHAEVGLEEKSTKPDQDFKLYIQESVGEINMSSLSYNDIGNQGFIQLNISPDIYSQTSEEKDYTFIVDVSGSMRDGKIEQAQKAIKYCVEKLEKDDNFQVIRFSTTAEKVFQNLQPATESNKKLAVDRISAWEAIGGTNMEAAFKLAFENNTQSTRKHVIVFITDGKPTIGEIEETKLLQLITQNNTNQLRIFTFGIGNDLNTHLLDKIAATTKAYRSYISENEKIDLPIQTFFEKVKRPTLSNVKITFDGDVSVTDLLPSEIPDLFYGEQLILVGKVNKEGNLKINLKGDINQKEKSMTQNMEIKFKPENDFIPFIWATRQVGLLLEQIRLKGETQELKDEIVHLAKKYGIITPYTSYLILEDETIVTPVPHPVYPLPYRKILEETYNTEISAGEYQEMQKKAGAGSTQSSKEIQQLSNSENIKDLKTGQSRMQKNTLPSAEPNSAKQRNNQGRAFYQYENTWVDAQLGETSKSAKVKTLQFASDAYFAELNKYPQLAAYFCLGVSCKFVYQGIIYSIEK
jgi:Ca-activated chloride channel family protein